MEDNNKDFGSIFNTAGFSQKKNESQPETGKKEEEGITLSFPDAKASPEENDDKNKGFFSIFGKGKNPEDKNTVSNPNAAPANNEIDNLKRETIIDDKILNEQVKSSQELFDGINIGELVFPEGPDQGKEEKKPINWFYLTNNILSFALTLVILGFVGFFAQFFVLTGDYGFVTKVPFVCEYIQSQIPGYNNQQCKPMSGIIEDIEKQKKDLDKEIYVGLNYLITNKLKVQYIASTPEVTFILKKKQSQVYVSEIFKEFQTILTSNKHGVVCTNYVINDKLELNVDCNFYGSAVLNSNAESRTQTSRYVALDFLKMLQSKSSRFTLLEYPKDLSINKYDGGDDTISGIYSTVTNLKLKLSFNLSNNQ